MKSTDTLRITPSPHWTNVKHKTTTTNTAICDSRLHSILTPHYCSPLFYITLDTVDFSRACVLRFIDYDIESLPWGNGEKILS